MEFQKKIEYFFNGESYLKSIFRDEYNNLREQFLEESFQESYEKKYSKLKVKKIISLKAPKKIENVSGRFLRPLREFQKYIKKNFTRKELVGVYVHGSLGTGDYVENYSDFDALIVIKKEVLNSEKKMKNIRKKIRKANTFLYLLDPLQHHELFIITELDMNYYFEPIFPLELFKYAKEITNFRNELKFRCLEDEDYLNKIFDLHKNYFFNNARFSKKNVFFIKNFIQNTLLLPTIYYQLKNKKYIYKKYSFEKTKKDFSEKDWKIIEKCTKVRDSYQYKSYYPYWFRKFIGFNFHYKFLKLLHRYFDRNDFQKILEILGETYLDETKNLINKMEMKLRENEMR